MDGMTAAPERAAEGRPGEVSDVRVGAGRALRWSLANTAAGKLGTLAIGVALARLLGPAEFGTYAVAFVALMAMLSFNELGVSLAVVRWPGDPREIVPTVNSVSVSMSAALTVVVVSAAPWFATVMGDPGAARCVQALGLCVLINGVVATPAALLQRTFRQDQRMIVDQVNTWLGAVVSIVAALAGLGAMSLVIGRLTGAVVSGCLLLRYSPVPYRFAVNREHLRALVSFGLPLAGASVVVFLVGFLDQLTVGHLLGAGLLGYYVLAVNLAGWPVAMFSQPLRSVAPALFARLQHDPARMREDFLRVLRVLSVVALPVCAGLAVGASDLVRLVYGDVWAPAASVLRILVILAALRILFELVYDFLVVLGRSRAILLAQIASVVVLMPTLWWSTTRWGIDGAALALLAVAVAVTVPLYLAQLHLAGLGVDRVLGGCLVGVLLACATACSTALLLDVLPGEFRGLAASAVVGAALVGAGVWHCRRDLRVWGGEP